jgi:hypothetical protein
MPKPRSSNASSRPQEQFERFTPPSEEPDDDKPSVLAQKRVWAKKQYAWKPPTIEETIANDRFLCTHHAM